MVAKGEDKTITGWLKYGSALNEGRAVFDKPNGTGFHNWLTAANLSEVRDHDRAAAMWGAEDTGFFAGFRKVHPRVRTVRSIERYLSWSDQLV